MHQSVPARTVPHFVRPFEDPFVRPVKKPSPPSLFPPQQLLVEQQLPLYSLPSQVDNSVPARQVQDCPVNHSSIKPPELKPPSGENSRPTVPVPESSQGKMLDVAKLLPTVDHVPSLVPADRLSVPAGVPPITITDPVLVVPDPVRIVSCHRYCAKVKSRLDSPVTSEQLEEISPQLLLTKGPPDKLDASPHKLRFLATFGLTTLTARNEIELSKLERCRSLPSVVLVTEGEESPILSSLSLPLPRRSPRSLPHCDNKLTFMSSLKLYPLSGKERKERETIWQEVLAERRRRQCVTPLVQYCCQQRVHSPDSSPIRWPGIEGVLHAYQAYHTECSLEASVLREECSRLQEELSDSRGEARQLEQRLCELRAEHRDLEHLGQDTQRSVDALMAIVRAIMALGHSND